MASLTTLIKRSYSLFLKTYFRALMYLSLVYFIFTFAYGLMTTGPTRPEG